jgi:hypothetical protein
MAHWNQSVGAFLMGLGMALGHMVAGARFGATGSGQPHFAPGRGGRLKGSIHVHERPPVQARAGIRANDEFASTRLLQAPKATLPAATAEHQTPGIRGASASIERCLGA